MVNTSCSPWFCNEVMTVKMKLYYYKHIVSILQGWNWGNHTHTEAYPKRLCFLKKSVPNGNKVTYCGVIQYKFQELHFANINFSKNQLMITGSWVLLTIRYAITSVLCLKEINFHVDLFSSMQSLVYFQEWRNSNCFAPTYFRGCKICLAW